ncbi:MAG: hypothetical protein DSY57_00715 [Desulfobulbus sp.]|nr:MAG: hypothetical protein DSY57_00715 [Desulfobulbus sp.]
MFSHFFHRAALAEQVDLDQLRKRFDPAMTKKLAVIKLPPSFWMQDPKINPRADHLLWAALLLDDPDRAALAFSAMAVEHEERQRKQAAGDAPGLAEALEAAVHDLLQLIPKENHKLRSRIRRLAGRIAP